MSHASGAATAGSVGGVWPPFTMAQWQELEHQAFIFKYLKAGLPVPPDLIAPIRRSFESVSARLFPHPSLGYSSLYGKKYDPEPGRCRRTDGKKWRCSKDAYPDSKYCERHMNRSRNRSRKPVESKTTPQSLSTVASGAATATSNGTGSSRSLPLHSYGNHEDLYRRSNASQLQLESIPYGVINKEYRGRHEHKPEADKHNFIPEVSGSINSSVSTEWYPPAAQLPSYPLSEPRSGTLLQFNQPQQQDYEPVTVAESAMSKQQQEHYFFGMDFSSQLPVKQDQSLQPLFDEWPKTRQFGSYMGDQKPDSTTQLSMSIPMVPSDFLSRRAHSPNDG